MTEPVSNMDERQRDDAPEEDEEMEEARMERDTGDADAPEPDDDEARGDGEGAAQPDEPDAFDGTELDTLREDFDDLNDRHLRLAAEFNNYRRRVEQERLDTWARAQADLVGDLLDVLDDLQRVAALDLTTASVEGIMEGIDLVEQKFVRTLEDAGAEVLAPEPGTRFDPESMEAMMRVPSDTEEEDDTVAQVFQKGYAFKGRLVRPSRVSVHKHDG